MDRVAMLVAAARGGATLRFSAEAFRDWTGDSCSAWSLEQEVGGSARETARGREGESDGEAGGGIGVQDFKWMHGWVRSAMRMCLRGGGSVLCSLRGAYAPTAAMHWNGWGKGKMEKDPAKYVGKMDELIIADQLARYPKSMGCPVMDTKALPDPTGPEAKECTLIVYKNRLVRFCCTKCTKSFYKDPDKYIAKLDAAAIAEQKKNYPMTTCVVTGGGFKESSPWFVVGDRAVRVCCGGCKGKAMKNPRGAMAKLDAATKASKSAKTSS